MESIQGFAAFEDGKPVELELSDEIVGGLTIADPIPIFRDAEDAKEAALSNQSRYGNPTSFEIREVTLTIGDVVQTAEYDENEENEEDEEDEEGDEEDDAEAGWDD